MYFLHELAIAQLQHQEAKRVKGGILQEDQPPPPISPRAQVS